VVFRKDQPVPITTLIATFVASLLIWAVILGPAILLVRAL
jgi:hypothetical protein